MVQVLPSNAGLGARLGGALGQSLAETLPKEMERGRLRYGLQQLGQRAGQLSPFEQAAELSAIPGMTPENIPQFLELLRLQNAAREQQDYSQQPQGAGIPQGQEPSQFEGQREEASNYLIPLSPEQRFEEAKKLHRQMPNTYRTVEEAERKIAQRDDERIAKDRAHEAKIDIIEGRADKAVTETLGKAGYAEVDGEIVEKMKQKALASAKNPRQAANEMSKDILDLSKSRNNVRSNAGFFQRLLNPRESTDAVLQARNTYKKYGAEEMYKNDLMTNYNLSDQASNYVTYPIEDNPQLDKYISGLSKSKVKYSDPKGFFSAPEREVIPAKSIEQVTAEIAPLITDDTSLHTIALELEGKGYNGSQFLNLVRNNPSYRLLPRQTRELETQFSVLPRLDDIMFFSMIKEKKRKKRK